MFQHYNCYAKELFRKFKGMIFVNIVILLLISTLSILGPIVMREITDRYIADKLDLKFFAWYFMILTLMYVLKFLYNRFKFKFAKKFNTEAGVSLYKMIFEISYGKLNELEPTYLAEKNGMTVSNVFRLFLSSLSGIFLSGFTIFVLLVMVFFINPILFCLYFLQIPLQYYGFKVLLNGERSRLAKYSYELQTIRAKTNTEIKAVLSNADVIKQFGYRGGLLKFIRTSLDRANEKECEGNTYAMDVCTVLEYACKLLQNGIYVYIIYLFTYQFISVGDMIYLNLINEIYFSSIGSVIDIQVNLKDLKASFKFVIDEVEANKEEDGEDAIEEIRSIHWEIENLGYEDALIKEGEIDIKKGDIVFLSGASGTGKSTLVKGIGKFIKTDKLYIDGKDINHIKNDVIRDKVFYVSQQPYILPFTIKENITLGVEYPDEIWKELEKKEYFKKFLELKNGLDTVIFENGANLSGGDKQKIVMARIFLTNPDVIILDEATAQIDDETGLGMIEDIIKQFGDKIIIMISHNEKCMDLCNKVIRIKDKRIV